MNKHLWELQIKEENGDLVLPLPEDLLKTVGWEEGDELDWVVHPDGTASLTKLQKL